MISRDGLYYFLNRNKGNKFSKLQYILKTINKMIFKKLCIVAIMIFGCKAFPQNVDWVKSLGGTGYDIGRVIAADANGNVYTAGTFTGTVDFDLGTAVYNLVSGSANDIFILKLNAAGNFLWAKSFGHTIFSDQPNNIKVDLQGNVYVTGWFTGTVDFNPGPGTFTLTSSASYDAFILKLDAVGNFVWAANFGANSISIGGPSLAISQSGDLYLTGYFGATVDFDPGPGIFNMTTAGVYDVFILKLNASGNFVWAKSMGDQYSEMGSSVAVDGAGNVYTTGHFHSSMDFDPGPLSYMLTPSGLSDIFISKLDAAGNFLWAKSMGGSSADGATSIVVDALGNVYTTGSFSQTADFDPGPGTYSLISAGLLDIFISKLNASGNFVWARSMGTASDDEQGNTICIDLLGNTYLISRFRGTMDFNPGPGINTITAAGLGDIFIEGFDASGNFSWVKCIGGASDDYGYSIAFNSGNLYATGFYSGAVDFDPGSNQYNLNSVSGNADVFILKLNSLQTGIHNATDTSFAGLVCYPNPTHRSLRIESSIDIHLSMINSLGQTLQTLELKADTGYKANIEGFSPGVYFLIGQSAQGTINQKIIVTD